MPRFFIDSDLTQAGSISLNREESRHAVSVMRLKEGDPIELFDGRGHAAAARVKGIKNGRVSVLLTELKNESRPAGVAVTLAACVIRPERMEMIIQKACELGAAEIVPILSERGIVRLSKERWESKETRWRKVILESCKQCGQSRMPRLGRVRDFADFIRDLPSFDKIILPTLTVPAKRLVDALGTRRPGNALVLIGPEGDFTKKEAASAMALGACPVSLGPRVLRSETAAIYALSTLLFYYSEVLSS